MSVYVDNARIGYKYMIMSHMLADSEDELDAMARRLKLPPSFKQHAGTRFVHYDLSVSKAALAIRYGAQYVSTRTIGHMLRERRLAEIREEHERLLAQSASDDVSVVDRTPRAT